jgi:hypothetical protein
MAGEFRQCHGYPLNGVGPRGRRHLDRGCGNRASISKNFSNTLKPRREAWVGPRWLTS